MQINYISREKEQDKQEPKNIFLDFSTNQKPASRKRAYDWSQNECPIDVKTFPAQHLDTILLDVEAQTQKRTDQWKPSIEGNENSDKTNINDNFFDQNVFESAFCKEGKDIFENDCFFVPGDSQQVFACRYYCVLCIILSLQCFIIRSIYI